MIGLILAAGEGKRLFGADSAGGCKPLVTVNGKKLLSYSLDNLISLGVEKAVIVAGSYIDDIRKSFGSSYDGIELVYAYQEEAKGIVNAILSAEEFLCDDFVLQLSDEIFVGLNLSCNPLQNTAGFAVGYVVEKDQDKIKGNYSIETDAAGNLLKCTEKPTVVTNEYKGTGFCLFKKQMVEILKTAYDPETNRPNDLCDFINLLIHEEKVGCIFEVADREFNINTETDLNDAIETIG